MPRWISQRLKQVVIERAFGCCEYCLSQERYSPVTFSIEHIIPSSRGGIADESNLAFSCQECNNRKYNKIEGVDPVTQTVVSLFHPRQHVWQEHFVWSDDFTTIISISPLGRATIEILHLHRIGLVNLRRILEKAGRHPPIIHR
jgi:hypothetical protein